MKRNLSIALLLLACLSAGCSNRAVYDGIRINRVNACAEQPAHLYEQCLERYRISYDEYARRRDG